MLDTTPGGIVILSISVGFDIRRITFKKFKKIIFSYDCRFVHK